MFCLGSAPSMCAAVVLVLSNAIVNRFVDKSKSTLQSLLIFEILWDNIRAVRVEISKEKRGANAMKRKCIAIFCVLALVAAMLVPCAAFANSAPSWYNGTSASGVVTTENCPLKVTKEQLTFNISDFPNWQNFNLTEYSSNVVAEYTFQNPTDLVVDVGVVFPFGLAPEYANADIFSDVNKYDVTVNGTAVEKSLRCTFKDRESFDIEKDLAKLRDAYVTDSYYNGNLKVYKNTYRVEISQDEGLLVFGMDTQNTRLLCDDDTNWTDTYSKAHAYGNAGRVTVRNGEEFVLYFVGENVDVCANPSFWKNANAHYEFAENGNSRGKIKGAVELVTCEELTFDDLAFYYYNASSGISRVDWYNAVVDMANEQHLGYSNSISQFNMKNRLMRWYQYQLHVEPHGTITNTVTAPIYPTVYYDYTPEMFSFEYLLSPASCWQSFSDLTVTVNTNFFLQEKHSHSKPFEKVANGYRFYSANLPNGELSFSLCSVENPKADTNWYGVAWVLLFVGGGTLLIVGGIHLVMLVATVVIVIVVLVRKRRNKQATAADAQPSGASMTEQAQQPLIEAASAEEDSIDRSQE